MDHKEALEQLKNGNLLSRDAWEELIVERDSVDRQALYAAADAVRRKSYGDAVYVRGLIEFTNYCGRNCYYCGIRAGNERLSRYRLTEEEILAACETGYGLGIRTFVLQGGEDAYFTDDRICALVGEIKSRYPDTAVTLSVGEKPRASYERYLAAGAKRYLLRHETADPEHYGKLHPAAQTLSNRKRCLYDLKEIGYQVGAGFMVGSPGQTAKTLAEDMAFLQELQPHMVGIGPFIPHEDTPLKGYPAGTLEDTLFFLALLRLALPHVLLPATTALATIHPRGREMGLSAGANVVMPNLSPVSVREKYRLYDGKVCTGEEAAECISCLASRVEGIGYRIVSDRGDWKKNDI